MSADIALAPTIKQFRSPQTVIGRFIARRTVMSATLWALVFGAYVASKAAGYAAAYPTIAERTKLATTFGSNIGLSALLGAPRSLSTVTGFTVWNTLNVMVLIGAIWGFLLATKTFRGEEDAGRLELLLTGQTTARRAILNMLTGLGVSLVILYTITAITFIFVGKIHAVNFGASAALFFALAVESGAVLFIVIGALASQLMPTRRRAASLAATIFGVSFLLRAMADTTSSAHWLLNITPLGWIEKLQPLYGSQSIWLLPIAAATLLCCIATIFLAGKRDLGASTFADKDSVKPHTALLATPLGLAVRLTKTTTLSWLVAAGFGAVFFGLLTKSAAQAFNDSINAQHVINRLTNSIQHAGATLFLGIVFFLLMILVMSYVASAIGAMREDEAEGHLDNLLVQPVSRLQWLFGRILLIVSVIVFVGFITSSGVWISTISQHNDIIFHTLLFAGINMITPAIFVLGVGVCALGVLPRFTTLVAYSVIAWSFLIQMVSSGLNLNHWILDTSILHHIALAPAVNPNWKTSLTILGISLALIIIGALKFNSRDLEGE